TRRAGSVLDLMGVLEDTIVARRRAPRDDIISALVTGPEPLDPQELLLFVVLLLVAGNESTTSLIGNALLALWQFPDQLRTLVGDPGLAGALVEEALRFDAPVQGLARRANRDTTVGATPIPAGARVYVLYGSANRDPRRYPDADHFSLARDPQDHLAFG